jgi:hypothetical protein
MTSSTSSSRLASVLAVVLPLVILGSALLWFNHKEGGQLSAAATQMDNRLAQAPPDIVVLGNSLAERSVDPKLLVDGLQIPDATCQVLNVSQSRPPTWYAVLDNRVYGNAYHPRLVLVIGLIETMFSTDPGSTASVLGDYMDPDDAVIQTKTLGNDVGPLFLYPLRIRRDQLKTAFFADIRDATTGLVFASGKGSLVDRGKVVAEPALGRVFSADGAVDMSRYDRAIPIVDERKAGVKDDQSSISASYIPDLVALATSHQSRIVFVQVPLSSAMSSRPRLANVEHDLVEFLNVNGAGWLDLSQIGVPDSGFADQAHLNTSGRQQFTKVLAERLIAMGAMGDRTLARAIVPLHPSRVERIGSPPALPAVGPRLPIPDVPCSWRARLVPALPLDDYALNNAGAGMVSPVQIQEDGAILRPHGKNDELAGECKGVFNIHGDWIRLVPSSARPDPATRSYEATLSNAFPMVTQKGDQVWWIYPGTTGRFFFSEPWSDARGPFSVDATALLFGSSDLPVTLRAGDAEPARFSGGAALARAIFEGDAPRSSNWAIEVASPKNGPYVLLTALSLGQREQVSNLVGHFTGGKGQSLVLVGTPKTPFDFTFDHDPPTLEAGEITPRGSSFSLAVPDYDFLVSSSIHSATDAQGCDPIQLLVDGAAFPVSKSGCEKPKASKEPAWCHAAGYIWFSNPGQPDPRSDGHSYGVGLDPTRKCNNYRMLYPGDTLLATQKKKAFLVGADHVDIRGHRLAASGPDGLLHMKVLAAEKVLLDQKLPMSATTGGIGFDLPGRVDPSDTSLAIELSTPSDAAYYLLVSLALTEERPFEDLVVLGGNP